MAATVKFDPGIGELSVNFNDYINVAYTNLMGLKTIHQKRAAFKITAPKIKSYIENNIAFYWGCLLYAFSIYSQNIDEPKEISGNVFYNMSEDLVQNYDYLIQVNFMENYFDSFERDTLYYTGQKQVIPETWKKILECYKEFLTLNEGFIKTKTTSDLKLPEIFSDFKCENNIDDVIDKAIDSKDLSILLSLVKFPQNC